MCAPPGHQIAEVEKHSLRYPGERQASLAQKVNKANSHEYGDPASTQARFKKERLRQHDGAGSQQS